jgi:very-short-patch-repair endonuclease
MPIRQLMKRAGAAIQALKPVFMMSPLSVAQFLEPGALEFDLLMIDEASQIQPVDALGAIARCRQVVVVGDDRQLPPTRFFDKMIAGDDEDDEDDDGAANVGSIESILGLCVSKGLPQRMLRWHYRSRHQSLIAVSNSQFYDNRLFIVPSPYTRQAGMGLRFHHLPHATFDRGNTATNVEEAKEVAKAIIQHAREHADLSLGVATFSSKQRGAVWDELERLRRLNPDTEGFFTSHPAEPFFVKNLENVQGDERDVILISVGYGRSPQGYMAMQFGPLSRDGGERRLNVLISRAKRRCEVFSSITDEDIDVERGKGKGVAAFKLFLHFARTGKLGIGQPTDREHDSVFEEQVAKALRDVGYDVHAQVGLAGFFIDLAIADYDKPGRYILGIECDGAPYHSSRSARDRDRLRQAVLEDHGWIIHRIWSTDWFHRPQEQLKKTIEAIDAAKAKLASRDEGAPTSAPAVPREIVTVEREHGRTIGVDGAEDAPKLSIPYREASIAVPSYMEIHDVPTGMMANLVKQIVEVEGPVHESEIIARIRSLWGLQRAGNRIQQAVERGIKAAIQGNLLFEMEDFLVVPSGELNVRGSVERGVGIPAKARDAAAN